MPPWSNSIRATSASRMRILSHQVRQVKAPTKAHPVFQWNSVGLVSLSP